MERPYEDFAAFFPWRRTKCAPRDYAHRADRIADQNQAIHEFVGEVAELGELLLDAPIAVLHEPGPRLKLINEIGDILFCGCWLLDALGDDQLTREARPDPEGLLDLDYSAPCRLIGDRAANIAVDPLDAEQAEELKDLVQTVGYQALILASLCCNSFKKELYQQRPQPPGSQARRVLGVFQMVAHLLLMAGASVGDALRMNVEKLDARYPEGYKPGVGGGIRTGKGA